MAPGPLYSTGVAPTLFAIPNYGAGVLPVPITYDQWKRVYNFEQPQYGKPTVLQYSWSPVTYAQTTYGYAATDLVERLSYAQWTALGQPSPTPFGNVLSGGTVYRWSSSDEPFLTTPAGEIHKLTYLEWQSTRFRQPELRTNQGFVKLSWDPGIAFSSDLAAGTGRPVGVDEWSAQQHPRPLVQARFPGDQLVQACGSSAIVYCGPTLRAQLTYAQWQAAGAPAPTRTGGC